MNSAMTPAGRISAAISAAPGKTAIVAFLTAGYPSREKFREHLTQIGNAADVVEIGVPFSDPMADGPVIQEAGQRADGHDGHGDDGRRVEPVFALAAIQHELQRMMQDLVGIVRREEEMERALAELRKLRERYPDVNAKLFYRRDIERLAQRYRLHLAS